MEQEVYYKFVSLDLSQFATFEEGYNEDKQDIDVSCKFSFTYNFVQNHVCCSNSIFITKNGLPLMKAELDATFAINDSSVKTMTDGGEIVLQPELQAQFASLTYGTMRGVIFAKTLNSPLNKIILPPNDVLEIFNKSIRFKSK